MSYLLVEVFQYSLDPQQAGKVAENFKYLMKFGLDVLQIPLFKTKFLMFIIYFKRERESRGGTQREGDAESEAGSRLRAVSTEPNVGLELMNREIMT